MGRSGTAGPCDSCGGSTMDSGPGRAGRAALAGHGSVRGCCDQHVEHGLCGKPNHANNKVFLPWPFSQFKMKHICSVFFSQSDVMYVNKDIELFSPQPLFPGGVLDCFLRTSVQLSLKQSNNIREST